LPALVEHAFEAIDDGLDAVSKCCLSKTSKLHATFPKKSSVQPNRETAITKAHQDSITGATPLRQPFSGARRRHDHRHVGRVLLPAPAMPVARQAAMAGVREAVAWIDGLAEPVLAARAADHVGAFL
jgi:hypothetical protein